MKSVRARVRRLRRTLEGRVNPDRFDPRLSRRLEILTVVTGALDGWGETKRPAG